MKSIVLAEKPSVGRELAQVLGCRKKAKGYSEGDAYIVTWAMGHLVELADPQAYDERYRTWSLHYLPMLPERMKHRVIPQTSGQFRTIQSLFRRRDVNNLIIATDAGREGELVARWIMRLGGWKGPYQRLWISSQTESAIREGFRTIKAGKDYDNLFRAAECRSEADWIIGLNISRALSCKFDARLSAGRVQTPTLALIVAREKEINNFKPESYWQVYADFGSYTGLWRSSGGVTRIKEEKRAREIAAKVQGKEGRIIKLEAKDKTEPPPLAYDLTALQREANSRLGFSAQKTLSTLQGLYERHKLVTYPRTDSRYISKDIVPTLKDRLQAVLSSRYRSTVQQLLAGEIKPGSRFVNDAKVSDHHALLPTEQRADPQRLGPDERALWEMIVARFLAVLSPDYRYKSITLITEAEGEQFLSRGIQVIDAGWKAIEESVSDRQEEEDEAPEQELSTHRQGETVRVVGTEVKQGFTKPPPRYTEATLLDAMEHAGRFIEDKELKASIAQGGIGTPATRAEIIEKLLSHYYIERRGRTLFPTPRGLELLDLVPGDLRSPELTARWEQRLSRIAKGEEKAGDFNRDIRRNATELVEMVKASTASYQPRSLSNEPCPVCGKMMMPVSDKKGRKMLVCQSLSCGYEQTEGQGDSLSRRPSRKQKAMDRRLIREYSDKSKETTTFADLIKAAQERQGKKP
ncbi:MAG: DNA topoisomerase III [Spirochaetaceae bacterium]|nr:MAG: DNA topoisomerase III [Spirochaetaceae bacterium]